MNEKHKSTLEKFENFLKVKNYSKNTIECYVSYLKLFLNKNEDISPIHLTQKHLENFIYSYKFTSISQQNQIYNSLKLFYLNILKSKLNKINLERPRGHSNTKTTEDICKFQQIY